MNWTTPTADLSHLPSIEGLWVRLAPIPGGIKMIDESKPTRDLSAEAMFFFEHGPVCYQPKRETAAEGRTRCAEEMADAEILLLCAIRVNPAVTFELNISPTDQGDEVFETATIWHCHRTGVRECLARIDYTMQEDDNFRRIVRAELAQQCIDALKQICNQVATTPWVAKMTTNPSNKQPRFAIGTVYRTGGKHPIECTVTDILRTYNSKGELVKIRYVATHQFCGQLVTDVDVVETTIARGRISQH